MKIYILDTNILLQDPYSIFKFEENIVVIPSIVLDELDNQKTRLDEVGKNARTVSKLIDQLREENPGQLNKGIRLENGGTFTIESNHRAFEKMKKMFSEESNDNRILAVALNLQEEQPEKTVIVVSIDVNMRVKADAIGLLAEKYESDSVIKHSDNVHKGYHEVYVNSSLIHNFYQNGELPIDAIDVSELEVHVQDFFIMKDENGTKMSALGRLVFREGKKKIIKLEFDADEGIWGITPKNSKQRMMMELLMDPDVPLVCVTGKAGTGKTLLALAAGLLQTEDMGIYKKMLAARPVIPMGKDIGYLPGDMNEKLRPWMQPIYDNLEYLFDIDEDSKKDGYASNNIDMVVAGLKLEVQALTYIRGRSIPQQYIIIDEAQNLSKHEVKTIITRLGVGSKIILLGDPDQIDQPYLDATNNGLTYVTEKMKQEPEVGIIHLDKTERSTLAEKAAKLL